MSSELFSFKSGSRVWVWDSTWLPAIVFHSAQTNCLLVRLAHGVTFSVPPADLRPRAPACRGNDIPPSSARIAQLYCSKKSGLIGGFGS
jgi:hypothetical protein